MLGKITNFNNFSLKVLANVYYMSNKIFMNPSSLLAILILFIRIDLIRSQPDSPVLVIEISRFGIRAPPVSTYDSTWGDEYAELTSAGIRQQYLLGRMMG
jgi:hypothetical protein